MSDYGIAKTAHVIEEKFFAMPFISIIMEINVLDYEKIYTTSVNYLTVLISS